MPLQPHRQKKSLPSASPSKIPLGNNMGKDGKIELFEFFWGTKSPFSNFHPAKFAMDVKIGHADPVKHTFEHSEQAFMFCKALFAGDTASAESIIKTKAPGDCKRLGRKVKNLDCKAWSAVSTALMRSINSCKFAQNTELLAKLMETGDRRLVEASPYDSLWGIGLKAADARKKRPEEWPGENRLGRVLTDLREDFRRRGPFSETARVPK